MRYKHVPGTTTKWFIEVIESKPGSLHSPVYVSIKKDGEEKQIFLDSLTYLVDLLCREFEDGRNFLGVPPLTINRATKAISDYFDISDFSEDLAYEYYKFIKEEGLAGPSGVITAHEIKELYERSAQLKHKLYAASNVPADEVLEDAIEHLKSDDEHAQED
jgi:hypothetical protein